MEVAVGVATGATAGQGRRRRRGRSRPAQRRAPLRSPAPGAPHGVGPRPCGGAGYCPTGGAGWPVPGSGAARAGGTPSTGSGCRRSGARRVESGLAVGGRTQPLGGVHQRYSGRSPERSAAHTTRAITTGRTRRTEHPERVSKNRSVFTSEVSTESMPSRAHAGECDHVGAAYRPAPVGNPGGQCERDGQHEDREPRQKMPETAG